MDNIGVIVFCVVLLLGAMFLSRGGKATPRYDIQRSEETRLARVQQDKETAMQVRARAARIEDAARERKPKGLLMRGRYPGLYEPSEPEVVYGEVVDDPQLPSGHRPLLGERSERSKRLLGG